MYKYILVRLIFFVKLSLSDNFVISFLGNLASGKKAKSFLLNLS